MYIIVIGCGRVGAQLASFLSGEGHDVVVIDTNPKAFRRLGAVFNGKTFVGVGFDIELLKKAGAEKADAVAVVTDLDNTNIMVAQVAKKIFNISKVITRLVSPSVTLTSYSYLAPFLASKGPSVTASLSSSQ